MNQDSNIDGVRGQIMALDKLRQTHQIDNPEYLDRLVSLCNKQIVAARIEELETALSVIPAKVATGIDTIFVRDRIAELKSKDREVL